MVFDKNRRYIFPMGGGEGGVDKLWRKKRLERHLVAIDTFIIIKTAENWFNKKIPKYFGLKEPYLDVIFYLGNQRYHIPPPKKNA